MPDDPRPTLLLTRPHEGSERFAQAFRNRFGADWPVVIAPLTRIVFLRPEIPASDTLIFTSQHAVDAFCAIEPARGRRAYCVGAKTADVAQSAGFRAVAAGGDAESLLAMILQDHPTGALLHARGETVARAVSHPLNAAGIETFEAVVYAQRDADLSHEGREVLARGQPIIVPLFSPQSAVRFFAAADDLGASAHVIAISAAVAARCEGEKCAEIAVASSPDAEAMLDAAATVLCGLKAG
jgi:uroporphyrinogen-III synthase